MARASALSKALLAAGAIVALRLLSGETFVTPKQRNEAAAAMAAAMVAVSAPAMAEARILVFLIACLVPQVKHVNHSSLLNDVHVCDCMCRSQPSPSLGLAAASPTLEKYI